MSQRFELATAMHAGRPVACIHRSGRYWPLGATAQRLGISGLDGGLIDLFAAWDNSLKRLEQVADGLDKAADLVLPAGLQLLTPLQYPGKVLCAGANYYDHLAEMGFAIEKKEQQRLFFFFKPPRQALVGPGKTVRYPRDTKALDWEVELCAVIGRAATAVSVDDALAHVAAWSVGLDMSARDLNRAPDQFYKFDWVAGKAQDTCGPMGPHLVPAAFVGDPQALRLWCKINGETKQDSTTGQMIYSVAEQIANLSRIMTLEPGDVIFTGTPAGVGAPKQTFLKPGDRVEAGVERVGEIAVEITPPI